MGNGEAFNITLLNGSGGTVARRHNAVKVWLQGCESQHGGREPKPGVCRPGRSSLPLSRV